MDPTLGTSPAMPLFLAARLTAVIGNVSEEMEGAAHVALALSQAGEWWSAICTDPTAEALNEIERTSGGPALDALWSGRIARITSTLNHAQWPEYIEACRHHGVGSAIAIPISNDHDRIGVMTVASKDYYAFGPEETRIGVRAATRAANALVGQPLVDRCVELGGEASELGTVAG